MDGYKLATYQASDGPRAGLVIDDKVFDAAKLTGKSAYASVLGILEDWRTAKGVLRKAAAAAKKSRIKALPLGRTKLLAPVLCSRGQRTASLVTAARWWRWIHGRVCSPLPARSFSISPVIRFARSAPR